MIGQPRSFFSERCGVDGALPAWHPSYHIQSFLECDDTPRRARSRNNTFVTSAPPPSSPSTTDTQTDKMPKFFCDYCDVYLTHDSMSVRKAHNSGRNHLRNVVDYYQQIGHEKAQSVIDSITSSYAAEGQAHNNPMLPQNQPGQAFPPPFPFPGGVPPPFPGMPAGAPPFPQGMMPPPGQGGRGMPPMPPFPPGPNGSPMPPGGLPFPPPGGLPAGLPFPPPGAPGSLPPPNFQFPGMPPPGAGGFPGGPPPGAFPPGSAPPGQDKR
ncbi:U1 zinc finger [Colletotrichum karsti]|uniref:U1 small nuclear ribonucleoprotein C n=1 Tax=Colletotrichum karsti TaxID=1095194 RepID=A0A9P6LMZ4_9PEZI|nr:U1 zinc finger [Colletotrichum karsti]KAF9882014.1 U1 zinc finger [Colletotrichum karsti]